MTSFEIKSQAALKVAAYWHGRAAAHEGLEAAWALATAMRFTMLARIFRAYQVAQTHKEEVTSRPTNLDRILDAYRMCASQCDTQHNPQS